MRGMISEGQLKLRLRSEERNPWAKRDAAFDTDVDRRLTLSYYT